MPLTLSTVVAAARDQVSCRVEGEVVILNLADEVYYGLDPVGARVWGLMSEPRTVAELRDAIVAEYDVDAATAERDLLDLLEEMASRGLVEVRGEA
jgi:hypothetical protein